MSKRSVSDLKELFKQASEIAKQVPENMQEAAFHRAIDLLAGNLQIPNPAVPQTNSKSSKQIKTVENKSSIGELLSLIDSTKHPEVTSAHKVLDRSLMVLQIVRSEHNVDGLSPNDIATILTEKFRISTSNPAVSMALGKATTLVNRISSGFGYIYKIMAPGEEYLLHLEEPKASAKNNIRVKPKRISKKTKNDSEKSKESTKVNSRTTKTQSTSKVGPKAAIMNLLESGYFSKGRTGPEVQEYLKDKRGFTFGTDQLRLAMLRLVRDEKLERDENSEGEYEYKNTKS